MPWADKGTKKKGPEKKSAWKKPSLKCRTRIREKVDAHRGEKGIVPKEELVKLYWGQEGSPVGGQKQGFTVKENGGTILRYPEEKRDPGGDAVQGVRGETTPPGLGGTSQSGPKEKRHHRLFGRKESNS